MVRQVNAREHVVAAPARVEARKARDGHVLASHEREGSVWLVAPALGAAAQHFIVAPRGRGRIGDGARAARGHVGQPRERVREVGAEAGPSP